MSANKNTDTQQQNTQPSHLEWRLLGSYIVFQILNLVNLFLAAVISACLLAFYLALRGETITLLLPWFAAIALPLWLCSSLWVFSLLVRHGVLASPRKKKTIKPSKPDKPGKPGKAARAPASEPANDPKNSDDSPGMLQKIAPLRRLLSL